MGQLTPSYHEDNMYYDEDIIDVDMIDVPKDNGEPDYYDFNGVGVYAQDEPENPGVQALADITRENCEESPCWGNL